MVAFNLVDMLCGGSGGACLMVEFIGLVVLFSWCCGIDVESGFDGFR